MSEIEYEYEYRLERKVTRPNLEGEPYWEDASGYNNTNGGVYRTLGAVKGVITRNQRLYKRYGWPVEFRILRRPTVKPPWEEIDV